MNNLTSLEIALIIVLWITLGLFICNKAKWYKRMPTGDGFSEFACVMTVALAPLVFVVDFVNRFFIQKWHDDGL